MSRLLHILFLFLPLLAQFSTFAQVESPTYAPALADSIYVDNTIRDTVKLDYGVTFETIERREDGYYAITSEGREINLNAWTSSPMKTLITDSLGHQLVIAKDGTIMGVEEYKTCGTNKILLNAENHRKDSLMATEGNVTFYKADDYLFDTYDTYATHQSAQGYAKHFPSIGEGNYRPVYACAESNSKIKLKAEPYEGISFKTERGVLVVCDNGVLSVQARGARQHPSHREAHPQPPPPRPHLA